MPVIVPVVAKKDSQAAVATPFIRSPKEGPDWGWLLIFLFLAFPPLFCIMAMMDAGDVYGEDRSSVWKIIFFVLFVFATLTWCGAVYFLFSDALLSLLIYGGIVGFGLICLLLSGLIVRHQMKKLEEKFNDAEQ